MKPAEHTLAYETDPHVKAYETDPHAEEAAEPEQGQTVNTQTYLTADAMSRGTGAQLLVLATGAAFLSLACAAVLAKSVCSWIWGGKQKKSAETSKPLLAQTARASANQTQQVRWLQQGLRLWY
jgi:hypothetical protein